MMDDSSIAQDLEHLKIAARKARQARSEINFSNENKNTTNIVHVGYRFLQCTVAGVIFIYYLITAERAGELWESAYDLIYPTCFIVSLVLALSRLMKCLPNPKPIIPVTTSMLGWSAMFSGAIMAMRDAQLELDFDLLSDFEISQDPTFQQDLALCAMSLIGSALYLVHAWLCFDCWWWDKKQRKIGDAEASKASTTTERSDSDSGMSSDDQADVDGPGTSSGQRDGGSSRRRSKLSKKMKGPRKSAPGETDPITTLNEVLHGSVEPKQLEVEDEPVRLYCCCADIGNMIKRRHDSSVPAHEFQVVHVM